MNHPSRVVTTLRLAETKQLPVRWIASIGFLLLITCAVANAATPVLPEDITINNLEIAQPLTDQAGNPTEGRKIFASRKLGNCLACHVNKDLQENLFHGEIGPSLNAVANRWSEAQLRTIVVNAKAIFTKETVMPGFYSLEVGENVRADLIGKTILTAQQVEDVVAYLVTLK